MKLLCDESETSLKFIDESLLSLKILLNNL